MARNEHIAAVALFGAVAVFGFSFGRSASSLYVSAPTTVQTSALANGVAVPQTRRYVQVGSQMYAPARASAEIGQSQAGQSVSTLSLMAGFATLAAGVVAYMQSSYKRQTPSEITLALAAASGKKAPAAAAVAAEDRGLWFPGAEAPEWLTGEYPGDRGFDPLGLAKDPKSFERNRIAEVFHGRLAMLAFAGGLVPELQGKEPWFSALKEVDAVVLTTFTLAAIVAIAPLELWRYNGGFGWEKRDNDANYPGFDPFNLTSDETKTKEIKNGRLAMLAVLGFAVQAAVTGSSPLQNAAAHYADPFGANITTAMF